MRSDPAVSLAGRSLGGYGGFPGSSAFICGLLLLWGCTGSSGAATPATAPSPVPAPDHAIVDADSLHGTAHPTIAPREAYARGWMPLEETGVDRFSREHPSYDGRGVLIAILDSGIDPGIPGLLTTTTGERKILDLRDFSGEGAVPLQAVKPTGDSVLVAGRYLRGFGRVRAINVSGPYFAGSLLELPLGEPPASDLNGSGAGEDTLPILVTRATDGWVLYADTDGDGSLANERPVHDYLPSKEYFGWSRGGRPAPLYLAANFSGDGDTPVLDLFFDTFGHGSHVAGIAAGHDLYGVAGFDGVAPGAQLLGLKLSNNAQGGLSVTGSIIRAIDYAISFASARRLPLIVNLSWGVGNEPNRVARIDRMLDSVLARFPEVLCTISAGNDGPGLSTVGSPGSAERALSVGAMLPPTFVYGGNGKQNAKSLAYFSGRGGTIAKPDLVVPGIAYSTVPRWKAGDEVEQGTSMSAPYAAGLAARLLSTQAQDGRTVPARTLKQALMVTARPLAGATVLDDGTGLPDLGLAFRWLEGGHVVPDIAVTAVGNGANAAFRREGLASSADTVQEFTLVAAAGTRTASYTLRSSASWLAAPDSIVLQNDTATVRVFYRGAPFRAPGAYVGTVSGWGNDSLAGPAFRLVNTVIVPEPSLGDITVPATPIPAGGQRRVFFSGQRGRPFAVETRTAARGQYAIAFLHEPGGQPYREDNGIDAGSGEEAGVYQLDGRDVVTGVYEAVAVALPLQPVAAATSVIRSPLLVEAVRDQGGVVATLRNETGAAVKVAPMLAIVGAERRVPVAGKGSAISRIPLVIPAWAVHAVVDVSMEPEQWGRFTDFGITLFDSTGHQVGKSPMNYALGRLHVDVPQGSRGHFAELVLLPGLAEAGATERWAADVSVRMYADSSGVTESAAAEIEIQPGAPRAVTLPMPPSALSSGHEYFPLGILVLPLGGRPWTWELGLPESGLPLAQ